MIRGIAFDLDGTLIYSEHKWMEAVKNALQTYNIPYSMDDHVHYFIKTSDGVAGICNKYGLNRSEFRERKRLACLDIATSIEPANGAIELINLMYPKYKLSIASWSSRELINIILKNLAVDDKINAIVSHYDVENPKPHPEPYIKAAKLMDLDPARCVAIEDAPKGIISAKDAGMHCIAVPNEWTQDGDFTRADVMVKSLSDVTIEMINKLGGQ